MLAPSGDYTMPLAELLSGADARVVGDDTVLVRDLAYDSRAVTPGSLFFALPGENYDGRDFVAGAVAGGAVAAAVDRDLDVPGLAARILVDDVRRFMGPVAHRFYGYPTAGMKLAGITGTNGKTTTAFLVHHVLSAVGSAGLVGTVQYRLGGLVLEASRTTPESLDLARAFAVMREHGVLAAAMEVSSHALHQGRALGCRFDAVAFTNLSQDHLDYHGTMDEYFLAKRSLFSHPPEECVRVVNADDGAGRKLIEDGLAEVTYGRSAVATLRFDIVAAGPDGTDVSLEGLGFAGENVRLPLVGDYNASNACCAAAVCRVLGVEPGVVVKRLAGAPQVPGRLERIDEGQPFAVYVDYAHTPDGLANVIPAVRAVTGGRLITVFGCGGDRDRAKRPLMGEIAAKLSDRVIVTSDNPRTEQPQAIIDEILVGMRDVGGADYAVQPDRRAAIAAALAEAGPGDSVLLAGKGHESGQQIGKTVIPFDDRQVARELLAEGSVAGGPATSPAAAEPEARR